MRSRLNALFDALLPVLATLAALGVGANPQSQPNRGLCGALGRRIWQFQRICRDVGQGYTVALGGLGNLYFVSR